MNVLQKKRHQSCQNLIEMEAGDTQRWPALRNISEG